MARPIARQYASARATMSHSALNSTFVQCHINSMSTSLKKRLCKCAKSLLSVPRAREPNFLRNSQTNQNISATQCKDGCNLRVCQRAARQHCHSDPGPSHWSVLCAEIPELVSPETFSRTAPRNSLAIMARPSCYRIKDAYSILRCEPEIW
jgi:hypothetical protein